MFYKTRYYPVDVQKRIIYNDPARTEGDCSVRRGYLGKGTIGVKGERLNKLITRQHFEIVQV